MLPNTMNAGQAAGILQNIQNYDLGMVINAGRFMMKNNEDPNIYLYRALKHQDPVLRIKAIHVLLVTGNKETPRHLIPLLESGDPNQISAVLEALAFGRAPRAFQLACEHLRHEHLTVCRAAISAMRLLRVVEALPTLLDYLGESIDPTMAREAVAAIYELGGARPFIARWKKMTAQTKLQILNASPDARSEAKAPREEERKLLRFILNGDAPEVILAALGTIERNHSQHFQDELEQLFESDHPAISDKAGLILVESAPHQRRAGVELRVMMQRMANRHAHVAKFYCHRTLDFSECSIARLDEIMANGWPWSGFCKNSPYTLFGSYLGEVIRRNLGGEWAESPELGYHVVLHGKPGAAVFPFAVVKRRFDGEESRPLAELYSDLKDAVRP